MALTLAGPRLWIIIKEIRPKTLNLLGSLSFRRNLHAAVMRYGDRWTGCRNQVLPAAEESHSELGAATLIASLALHELQRYPRGFNNIDQLGTNKRRGKIHHVTKNVLRLWDTFLKRPLDIFVPVVLSVVFVAIFVAETAGTIMSARVVGDSVALSDSRRCFAPNRPDSTRLLAYVDDCYYAASGKNCNRATVDSFRISRT